MDVVSRLEGLYLALCYVALPVAALFLWREGRRWIAIGVLAAPFVAWEIWNLEGVLLSPFRQLYLSLGLMPLELFCQVAPIAWLLSLHAEGEATAGAWDRMLDALDRLVRHPMARLTGVALVAVGLLTFLHGLMSPGASCVALTSSTSALLASVSRAVGCLSSAVGLWVTLVPFMLLALMGIVRQGMRDHRRPARASRPDGAFDAGRTISEPRR